MMKLKNRLKISFLNKESQVGIPLELRMHAKYMMKFYLCEELNAKIVE